MPKDYLFDQAIQRALRLGHGRPPRLKRFKIKPLPPLELRPLPDNVVAELPHVKVGGWDEVTQLDPHPVLAAKVCGR